MKKLFFILGVLALAVAGFAMFKILNFNDDGKEKPENNAAETGNQTEAQAGEGTQAQGTGVNP